jgi:hypothetical protein
LGPKASSSHTAQRFDLEHLSDADADKLLRSLSVIAEDAPSRQVIAERLVDSLFRSLCIGDTEEPACALVRCFHTATYAQMPLHSRDAADQLLETESLAPSALEQMRCLVLLATRGIRMVWNDVMTSVGHQAIPLPSVETVRKAPMIARLFDQLGMPIELAVDPTASTAFILEEATEDFRVFHVEQAVGSPFIPAQSTFVEPFGIRSVLGIGGVLPDGELLAVVLFTRVAISTDVARRFGALAAAIRRPIIALPPENIFGGLIS